jgi:hypothetical protein
MAIALLVRVGSSDCGLHNNSHLGIGDVSVQVKIRAVLVLPFLRLQVDLDEIMFALGGTNIFTASEVKKRTFISQVREWFLEKDALGEREKEGKKTHVKVVHPSYLTSPVPLVRYAC